MEDKERHQCILGSRSLSHLCPLAGPSLTCQISSCSLFVSLHIICICLLNAHLILFESYTYMLHYIDAQVQCHFEDEICCQALAAWTVRVLLPQFHAIHVDKPLTIPTLLLFEKTGALSYDLRISSFATLSCIILCLVSEKLLVRALSCIILFLISEKWVIVASTKLNKLI